MAMMGSPVVSVTGLAAPTADPPPTQTRQVRPGVCRGVAGILRDMARGALLYGCEGGDLNQLGEGEGVIGPRSQASHFPPKDYVRRPSLSAV
ncbi:MAG: hypothetical protein M0Z47_11650 [Actinomycetota bacterium]|nr:hypothetical protein [Actinomycetota bacterium]